MTPSQPQKNSFTKNKKILLIFFIPLLFFLAGAFVLLNGNKNNIDSNNLYSENMEINGDTYPLIVETFKKNLESALTEPKWKALATVFKETCNPDGGVYSATFGNSRTFKELVQSVEPAKENLDGESLLIIPCGQGSYQSSYMIALYDGKIYEPLQIPNVSEDGKINYYYSAVEAGYDPKTNIVSTSASFNGMRTCGDSAESKLVGKKLILQKFSADWNCEDQELSEKVIYDINQALSKLSTQEWKTYRNTDLGFEISYPSTWSVVEENEYTRYVGFRNPKSEFKDYSEVIQVFKNLTWKEAVAKAGFKTPAEALKELNDMGINILDEKNTYIAFDGIGPPSSVNEININGMRGLIANITTKLFTIENNAAIAGDGQRVLLYTPASTLLIYGYDDPEIFNIMIQSVKLLP